MAYPSTIDAPDTTMQGTTLFTSDDHALSHRALGSAIINTETFLGTSAASNGLFNSYAAGQTPLPIQSGTLGTAITKGTFNNSVLGTPSIVLGSDAQGDIYYRSSGGTVTRLAPGTSGQVLQSGGASANPSWTTIDAWTSTSDTWTYVSAISFKITGSDKTATYVKGTRLKCTDAASTKYFVVVSSSFSTDTTVTITGGSDYSLSGGAITTPFYSYAASPAGYPAYFNYTVTWGGFSANPTIGISRFSVNGRTCHAIISTTATGTSNATTLTITLPINAGQTTRNVAWGSGLDNGAALTTMVKGDVSSGSTSVSVYKDPTGNGWTASGSKYVDLQILYEI